jgi:eukaryotic-like serine/threonine-protein kinase
LGALSISTQLLRRRSDDPASASPLKTIGGRRVLRRLGAGGMSEVYLAYDHKRHKQVAVKILPDDLAKNSTYVFRFLREAEVGQKIQHPNVVRCLEAGQDEKTRRRFLVMEYVKGHSALTLLERNGALPLADATRIVLDIARGLEELHHRGYVHRDVKPGNILIGEDGRAKLADLGVAKFLDPAVPDLTSFDQGVGTPFYMPWEQSLNASLVDPRSDLFSLGATFYHLVTGRVPFPGSDMAEVAQRKDEGTFAPAREIDPNLPRSVDTILAKLLARMPIERFQSATELIDALRASGLTGETEAGGKLVETEVPPAVTRPDIKLARKGHAPAETAPIWTYQYRHGSGWKRGRARAEDIIHWYEDGILPKQFFVARAGQKTCRDFRTFAEFRSIQRRKAPVAPSAPPRPKRRPRIDRILLIVGLAILLTASASLVFHLIAGGN